MSTAEEQELLEGFGEHDMLAVLKCGIICAGVLHHAPSGYHSGRVYLSLSRRVKAKGFWCGRTK